MLIYLWLSEVSTETQ